MINGKYSGMTKDAWNTFEFKRHCTGQLAAAPSERVFDADHAPTRGDHDLNKGEMARQDACVQPKPAAVLVPIIERDGHLSILLTRRQADLKTHGGQISFPGGKVEGCDGSPLVTALRETEEEVGIKRDFVDVLGYCDDYQTVTGYRIVPVVGLVGGDFKLKPDVSEVAEIFEVPFDFLMDAGNHRKESLEWDGKRRHYFAMLYGRYYIWGATAGILKNLHERLYC